MQNTSTPRARRFEEPRPNRVLMKLLGFVNRWCLLRGHFRIRTVDLPAADRARLARAVNPGTAAFLGPNHPEFGLDWMMDKEISTWIAPRMASWAAHGIVASARWFWLRNNLVANDGGPAAMEYSVRSALEGHGVLLHPEGSVHWTADRVHPLFQGIAEMATEAARRARVQNSDRPVFIVPVVWKLRHAGDASAAMHDEMRKIEDALGLHRGSPSSVATRFHMLQEHVLATRMVRFGFDPARVWGLDFFARQDAFRAHLVADLMSRHVVEPGESIERTIHRLQRVIRGTGAKEDAAKAAEAERLGGFSRDVYGSPTLSQEQIVESLKRLRATLMKQGLRNAIHNYLPTPCGPRVAHVRAPEPILVDARRAAGTAEERQEYVAALIAETRRRMQETLDAINAEVAPDVRRFSCRNPFFAPPETVVAKRARYANTNATNSEVFG